MPLPTLDPPIAFRLNLLLTRQIFILFVNNSNSLRNPISLSEYPFAILCIPLIIGDFYVSDRLLMCQTVSEVTLFLSSTSWADERNIVHSQNDQQLR